jgi:hypothetical protein
MRNAILGPAGPAGPAAPSFPSFPGAPSFPAIPGAPSLPAAPVSPFSPFGPCPQPASMIASANTEISCAILMIFPWVAAQYAAQIQIRPLPISKRAIRGRNRPAPHPPIGRKSRAFPERGRPRDKPLSCHPDGECRLWLGRIEARTGLRMMPTFPRSPYHSVRRVFPSTAGRLSYQARPSRHSA